MRHFIQLKLHSFPIFVFGSTCPPCLCNNVYTFWHKETNTPQFLFKTWCSIWVRFNKKHIFSLAVGDKQFFLNYSLPDKKVNEQLRSVFEIIYREDINHEKHLKNWFLHLCYKHNTQKGCLWNRREMWDAYRHPLGSYSWRLKCFECYKIFENQF